MPAPWATLWRAWMNSSVASSEARIRLANSTSNSRLSSISTDSVVNPRASRSIVTTLGISCAIRATAANSAYVPDAPDLAESIKVFRNSGSRAASSAALTGSVITVVSACPSRACRSRASICVCTSFSRACRSTSVSHAAARATQSCSEDHRCQCLDAGVESGTGDRSHSRRWWRYAIDAEWTGRSRK